jgi:cephalosporin-C deacetylase-like acetyl esterase
MPRRPTRIALLLAAVVGCAAPPTPKKTTEPPPSRTAEAPKEPEPAPVPVPVDWSALAAGAAALVPPGGKSIEDALEARAGAALAELEKRRQAGRGAAPNVAALRRALGLDRLPKPTPSNIHPLPPINRGDFVIERITYETFPGVQVPVLVYRPARVAEKSPAILFVPGHWWPDSKARHEFQTFAVHAVSLGFVVLTYDPIGQGERGISFRDHRRTELLPAGISQQGITVFESLCGLEYLLSLKYVDGSKIGITGASGGGYNSWMTAAVEPRIVAVAPVVGTSDFGEQIRVCRPLDWYYAREHCHFVPGLIRIADNHELLAMIAPRPVLVVSAVNDESFPAPGIRRMAAWGKVLYDRLGVAERFRFFEDASFGHGYQQAKREAVYGFFLRYLKQQGDGRPSGEPPVPILPPDSADLRCFPAGKNRPAGPGLIEFVRRRLEALDVEPAAPPPGEAEFRKLVTAALGLEPAAKPAEVRVQRSPARTDGGIRIERLVWRAADGVPVPALLVWPRAAPRAVLAAASDGGKEALLTHPAVRAAIEDGSAALLIDARGIGESAVEHAGWVFATSLLLGENFVGRQGADLASAVEAAAAIPELKGKPVGLLGVGVFASSAAAYAGVLEPRFERLMVEGGFVSYRSFIDRPKSMPDSFHLALPGLAGAVRIVVTTEKTVRDSYLVDSSARPAKIDREIPHALFVFDVFDKFDLTDLLSESAGRRPTLVVNPINGDFEPMSAEEADRLLSVRRFARPTAPAAAVGSAAIAEAIRFVRGPGK